MDENNTPSAQRELYSTWSSGLGTATVTTRGTADDLEFNSARINDITIRRDMQALAGPPPTDTIPPRPASENSLSPSRSGAGAKDPSRQLAPPRPLAAYHLYGMERYKSQVLLHYTYVLYRLDLWRHRPRRRP